MLLHGYGGTPGVARSWLRPHLDPTALLYAPAGLRPAGLAQSGREWFPITADPEELRGRAVAAAKVIAPRVREYQRRHGVSSSQTAIVGFSQGATVASCLIGMVEASVVVAASGRVQMSDLGPAAAPVRLMAVTGAEDRFATPDIILADLAAAARSPHVTARYLEIPRLGHAMADALAQAAAGFVDTAERGVQFAYHPVKGSINHA